MSGINMVRLDHHHDGHTGHRLSLRYSFDYDDGQFVEPIVEVKCMTCKTYLTSKDFTATTYGLHTTRTEVLHDRPARAA